MQNGPEAIFFCYSCVNIPRFGFVYLGYTHNTQTGAFTPHKHTQLGVLIHLLAICPGDLPRGCRAVAFALFLFPFLCCILHKSTTLQSVKQIHTVSFKIARSRFLVNSESYWRQAHAHLFVPLLMQVTQEDISFLCYDNWGANTESQPTTQHQPVCGLQLKA